MLVGAAAPAGPTIVRAEGVTAAALVQVQGALEGFRIESVPTFVPEAGFMGATGTGIAATCGAPGGPSIEDVTVDGGALLTTGIDVAAGECGATLSGVHVSRVEGPALSVFANAALPVVVKASRFRESAIGILATGGKLRLGIAADLEVVPAQAVEVSGNRGEGIVLTGGPTPTFRTLDVELLGTRVEENGGTGVVLDSVSTASKLAVRGCVIYANGEASPRTYGPDSGKRTAGGAVIRQDALAAGGFAFEANRLSSNAADQLGFETSGAWSIAPAAKTCGSSSNLFACVGEGNVAVGVAGPGGGTVNASHSVWPGLWNAYASAGVFIDSPSAYCTGGAEGAPAPPATCPAP
jgi:hypothetical protein